MLGSPRVISDQNGNIVSRRDFMPFGEEINGLGNRTASVGYQADSIRQKFTGYQRDNETNLDFAEARYYNSQNGRFTAVDPLIASGKSANPQSFNRYSYTFNNPLIFTDKSGLQTNTDPQEDEVIRIKSYPAEFKADFMNPKLAGLRNSERISNSTPLVMAVGGASYNSFIAAPVNLTNGVLNRMTFEYMVTGKPSDRLGYAPYYQPSSQAEANVMQFTSNTITATSLLIGMPRGAAPSFAGFTTKEASGPVTVYRVEGVPNQRLLISESGDVSIKGDRMLFLNFGDKARAESYLQTKIADGLEGAQIKSFQVNRSFLNQLRNSAVLESQKRLFPNNPLSVDVTQAPNQFGLRRPSFSELQRNIIPGSGQPR